MQDHLHSAGFGLFAKMLVFQYWKSIPKKEQQPRAALAVKTVAKQTTP
jgi:hypothetical protein